MKPLLKRAAIAAGAVAGATPLVAGAMYQARQTRQDDLDHPGIGELIDVRGRRTHVHYTGRDKPGPTVILEGGMSCPLETWAWIQPAIAEIAPVLSYDRCGLGWSEPARGKRTGERFAQELDDVLDAVGCTGPLILVAHSFGGMLIRNYADKHPERLAGMVLADSSHPEQLERSARQKLGLPLMRSTIQNAAIYSRFGLNRMRGQYIVDGVVELPEPARSIAMARMLTAATWQGTRLEMNAWLGELNESVAKMPLPNNVPLVVVTAGEPRRGDPMHDELQLELAELSTNSRRDVAEESSHLGLVMREGQAKFVTAAIEDVLASARTGEPLS